MHPAQHPAEVAMCVIVKADGQYDWRRESVSNGFHVGCCPCIAATKFSRPFLRLQIW